MTPDFIRKYHIYNLLVKTTINSCISREMILESLKNQYEDYHRDDKLYQGLLVTSEKTIDRDIKNIASFFGVEINHKRHKGYYMVTNVDILKTHRAIFDKMELFLASHKEQQWSPFITAEQSSLNTDINILGLVKAIEHQVYITISYQGWYDDDIFSKIKEATVQPLHIKEANKAWYLLVFNPEIGIKTLCLDARVSKLVITDRIINEPLHFDAAQYFNDAFGILNDDTKTETIRLKVANHHFKYLMSKPLHHSQTVISVPSQKNTAVLDYKNDAIFGEITVTLKPNYEFLIELFKFNLWVKVIEPKWLALKVVKQHQFILEHYYADIEV
ncbi:WYL domain-containing protein [Lacinutrix sp.]|uniref:helix-turn-helix transcriptional regulator n=1 Tax=Lacinutrix sp. TaxID=1937692 RepID=UPI0025BC7764|nr:WYL domain-containing protein [Lacinutrix sp.]